MDFKLSDDRRMLADSLNRFIDERYGFPVRERIAQSEAGYDVDLWRRFAELGVIGALFEEADGGFGGAGFDLAVVFECLGLGRVVEPFLAALIEGGTTAAFAHADPDSHYEPHQVRTRATAAGEDDAADGLALFVVPRETPGLALRDYARIDGGRAAELLERVTGFGLLALAAEAIGAMEVVKAQTIDYLRTRKQFGLPIGSFQALQHRVADLLLEIEQARSAVINAAAALEAPRPQRERALSAAKYTIGRTGTRVVEEAIQLHGGIGMTWELPLAHYAKRLVMIDHQLGDEDHHLARYIALGSG